MKELAEFNFLLTSHGTLAVYDGSERKFEAVDLNSMQTMAGSLVLDQDGKFGVLVLRPDGSYRVDDTGLDKMRTGIARSQNPGWLPVLRDDGAVLSAHPHGSVEFRFCPVNSWELFAPVDQKLLEGLRWISLNRWFSVSARCLLDNDCAAVRQMCLTIGNYAFPIFANADIIRATANGVLSLTLFYDGWKVEHFRLFRPLIYYVSFGEELNFSLLEQSLISLCGAGAYSSDVLLITDRARDEIMEYVPALLREHIHVLNLTIAIRREAYLCRYRIGEWCGTKDYQPLLYLDTDVVIDRDIKKTLIDTLTLNKIAVCEEKFTRMQDTESVGSTLFKRDGVDTQGRHGFNSGLLLFANYFEVSIFFETVCKVINHYCLKELADHPLPWCDQAIANYVGEKLDIVDRNTLMGRVRYAGEGRIYDGASPQGFVHFWGDKRQDKHPAMKEYNTRLDAYYEAMQAVPKMV